MCQGPALDQMPTYRYRGASAKASRCEGLLRSPTCMSDNISDDRPWENYWEWRKSASSSSSGDSSSSICSSTNSSSSSSSNVNSSSSGSSSSSSSGCDCPAGDGSQPARMGCNQIRSLMDASYWNRPLPGGGDDMNWDQIPGPVWKALPVSGNPIEPATSSRNKNSIGTKCFYSDFHLTFDFRCPDMRAIFTVCSNNLKSPQNRKRTAAPSGISVHQRHPAMVEFSPWRFFFLHGRVVCGRRGLDAHPCGRCGCDRDGCRPRCRGGGNGSPLSRQAARRVLL